VIGLNEVNGNSESKKMLGETKSAAPAFFAAAFVVALAALLAFAPSVNAAFNTTAVQGSLTSDFRLSDFEQTPDRVYPGDEVQLKMSASTVRTEGVLDAVFSIITPFDETTSTTTVNQLVHGEKKEISRTFTVPEGTKPGTYLVYVYGSASLIPQQEVARIPVVVFESSVTNLLLAQLASNESVNTGDSAAILVNLTNTGALDAEDVFVGLTLNSSGPFTPLEYDRKHVGRIKAGETAQVPFSVGVDATASPGFYPLTVSIIYSVDNELQPAVQQNLGLKVEANQQLLITSDFGAASAASSASAGGGSLLTLTVANVGDTAVRGVYLKASSDAFRIIGASDKFIGTLNLDDSSTMTLTLSPRATAAGAAGAQGARGNFTAGEQAVTVVVSYKDPLNQERVIRQTIPVQFDAAAAANGASGSTAIGSQRFVRQTPNQGFLGISWLYWGIAAAALAAGAGYWWFKIRKKKKTAVK